MDTTVFHISEFIDNLAHSCLNRPEFKMGAKVLISIDIYYLLDGELVGPESYSGSSFNPPFVFTFF